MHNTVDKRATHARTVMPRVIRNVIHTVIAVLLSVITPLVALAQVDPLDEATLTTVVTLAQRTGATLAPGINVTTPVRVVSPS